MAWIKLEEKEEQDFLFCANRAGKAGKVFEGTKEELGVRRDNQFFLHFLHLLLSPETRKADLELPCLFLMEHFFPPVARRENKTFGYATAQHVHLSTSFQ